MEVCREVKWAAMVAEDEGGEREKTASESAL